MEDAPQQELETMEAYLAGELPAEARAAFEVRLADSPALQEELALFREAREMVEVYGEEDLREMLGRIDAETAAEPETRPAKGKGTWRWVAGLAATAALVVALTVGLRPPLEQRLFTQYFAPYTDLNTYRDDTGSDLSPMMAAYAAEDFSEVLAAYRRLPQRSQKADLYAAVAHLGLAQGDSTLRILEPLQDAAAPLHQPAVRWYRSLAHLSLGEQEKAAALLKTLREEQGLYAKEAGEILDALD